MHSNSDGELYGEEKEGRERWREGGGVRGEEGMVPIGDCCRRANLKWLRHSITVVLSWR